MRLHDLRQIQDSYAHIYLSPHFDDAALSCGGAIALQLSQGQRVLVVSVCTAAPARSATLSPLAEEFHAQWGLSADEVIAVREQEDEAAMEMLGVDYFYLGFLDAIYRHTPYGTERSALFGSLASTDPLPAQLVTTLESIAGRAPKATIYCPLGVGEHVDHQAIYVACTQFHEPHGPIVFYEDIPYVIEPGSLGRRVRAIKTGLAPRTVEIGPMLEMKLRAIAAYGSQIDALFGGREQMREAIASYANTVCPEEGGAGERLWA